ncbi:MAG: WD40 repeat domain-containing protein, partial [bacterium]|nr:WD40 repeat domain-containing protein [bacterium]
AINNAATAVAAQATAEYNAVQALSQSLAVSAEQAVSNLNYDLAFALALESNRLNPTLVQNRRLLNTIVYTAARFSFPGSTALSFNQDNTRVLSTSGSTLTVWDLVTRQPVMELNGHNGNILTAAFSPDGTRIASGGTDNTLIIWDAASGLPIHTLSGHTGAINSLTWSPDSRWIITGSDDKKMFRWDAGTGSIVSRYENNDHRVVRVQYSASGLRFFAWTKPSENEQTMLILRVDNGASAFGTVNAYQIYQTFNGDGRTAIIGGLSGFPLSTVIADTAAQERQFTRGIDYNLDSVTASALNTRGSEIVIGFTSSDPTRRRLVLYSVANGEPVRTFAGEGARQTNALAFSPDGRLVLSGSNNQIIVWNTETGTEVRRLSAHNAPIESIRFTTDGRYAISVARNGDWRVWDVTGGDTAEQGRLAVNTEQPPVIAAAISPDGASVYAAAWTDLFFYDGQTLRQSNRVSTGDNMLNAVFSTTRPRALAVMENAAIYYNMENGTYIDYLGRSGETYTGQAAIGPDGDSVVLEGNVLYLYGPDLRPIRVWENKRSLYPGDEITGLAVMPDDSAILIASGDPDNPEGQPYPLVMLDSATGAEIRRFDNEHTATVTGVSISPDGRYALTTSADRTLIVWDIASGRLLRRLAGHTGAVTTVGISADSRYALSGSDDGSLILWDVRAGEPVRRFIGHTEPVRRVFFSSDGRSAISLAGSESVILWRIQAQEDVITWAQANRFIPGFTCAERVQYNIAPLCGS